jgi:hypothetical protein
MAIPMFGLLANLGCMLFYLVGPLPLVGVAGMSWKEPYVALGLAAVWGVWGALYFLISSKAKGRTTFIGEKEMAKIKV